MRLPSPPPLPARAQALSHVVRPHVVLGTVPSRLCCRLLAALAQRWVLTLAPSMALIGGMLLDLLAILAALG